MTFARIESRHACASLYFQGSGPNRSRDPVDSDGANLRIESGQPATSRYCQRPSMLETPGHTQLIVGGKSLGRHSPAF